MAPLVLPGKTIQAGELQGSYRCRAIRNRSSGPVKRAKLQYEAHRPRQEIAELQSYLAGAQEGQGKLCFISGVAGKGNHG